MGRKKEKAIEEITIFTKILNGLGNIENLKNFKNFKNYCASIDESLGLTIDSKGESNVIGTCCDDTILGKNTDDIMYGKEGNDTLNRGAGSDALYGGEGDDYLEGGDGAGAYIWGKGYGNDRINSYVGGSGQGEDKVIFYGLFLNDIVFSTDKNNLICSIKNSDEFLTIQNWSLGTNYQVDCFNFTYSSISVNDINQKLAK